MNYTTRAEYMDGTVTFEQHYGQFVEMFGENSVRSLLPSGARTMEEAAAALAEDAHFNRIPLARWDAMHLFVREHAQLLWHRNREAFNAMQGFDKDNDKFCWSLSDSVCVLKCCARRLAQSQ
jgi:hypothetical protein